MKIIQWCRIKLTDTQSHMAYRISTISMVKGNQYICIKNRMAAQHARVFAVSSASENRSVSYCSSIGTFPTKSLQWCWAAWGELGLRTGSKQRVLIIALPGVITWLDY